MQFTAKASCSGGRNPKSTVTESTHSKRFFSAAIAVTLLVAALAWHGYSALKNFNSAGLSGHEFRQTQTALSVQAMLEDGFRIDYSTPVLGKPWAIPMEFPLYQGIVAEICKISGLPIAQVGRGVSMFFFWLTLPALVLILREAKFSLQGSYLALIPVILAPVYMVYSRAVLIESMALAGSAWFLVGVLHYRRSSRWSALLLALIAGTVAVLVKPTTWSVFCMPWAVLFIRDGWKAWRSRRWPDGLIEQGLLIGVPLLFIAFGWVWIADQIKALNSNANFLLSSSLNEFNYGTWEQRFSSENWQSMIEHCRTNIGPIWIILLGMVTMLIHRASRYVGLLGVIAFVTVPLIFFGLYLLHDYYFYANASMLTLAMGGGLAALWDRSRGSGWAKPASLLLLGVIVWGQQQSHQSKLLPEQLTVTNGESSEVLIAKNLTGPDEVVVMHSAGWSSSNAYYSDRRFLTIPDFQMFFQRDEVYQSVAQLVDEDVTLLILSGNILNQREWTAERIKQLGFVSEPFAQIEGVAKAHTSRKHHDHYRELMKQYRLHGWQASAYQAVPDEAPTEKRVPIPESMWPPELRPIIGAYPEFGVIPFGLNKLTHEGQTLMMVHGGSELYFIAPPESTQFSCSFIINPESFDKHDWDGIEIMIEGYDANNKAHFLKAHLVEAQDPRSSRTMTADFNPDEYNYIRLRILPGLHGSEAYDHAWFSKLEFN